jgi:hypothetical protein
VAERLSDTAWADICAAATRHAPLIPDVAARERLSIILYEEYPAFVYDREREDAKRRAGKRMMKGLLALAEDYRQHFLPDFPADQFHLVLTNQASAVIANKNIEARVWSLSRLWQHAEGLWLVASAVCRAHKGHRNVQREWLYHRLCTVWLENFSGPRLTWTVPSKGGPPQGPLIDFMLIAFCQVMPERLLPAPETVRDAIERERRERENARQLVLQLRVRNGVSTLE